MKTTWDSKYLEQKHGGPRLAAKWLKAKSAEYTAKYEVPFCVYSAHGQSHIRPYCDFKNPTMISHSEADMDMADDISSWVSSTGISLQRLYELSHWPHKDIARTMRFLIKQMGYYPVQNRLGWCEGIKKPFIDY